MPIIIWTESENRSTKACGIAVRQRLCQGWAGGYVHAPEKFPIFRGDLQHHSLCYSCQALAQSPEIIAPTAPSVGCSKPWQRVDGVITSPFLAANKSCEPLTHDTARIGLRHRWCDEEG